MRRPILTAAAPACLLLGLTPVPATADVAPPGKATATAAQVADLVKVSRSEANADETKSDAKASVISVGAPSALGTGGSQSKEGETGGALIDTGPGQAPQVRVAPWKTKASGGKGSAKRSSSASAALARVDVPAQSEPRGAPTATATDTVSVGVLTSEAAAEHTSEKSTGQSTSNAVDVSVGNTLRLVLLHSEVDSSAKGNSYLVNLNGTKIGTQEQVGELCTLDLAGVAATTCLTASGGTANGITTGAAEVLGVQTALVGLNPASAFSTTGSTATGSVPKILESVAQAIPAPEAPRAAAATPPPAAPAVGLPRTGVAAASLAASAVAGLLMGLVLRLLGRRRQVLA